MAKNAKSKEKQDYGYSADKDVVLKDLGTIEGGGRGGDLSLRIVSYAGGAAKLAITRTGVNADTSETWHSPKLGRLNFKELESLMPLMEKALRYLEKKNKKSE